MKLFLEIRRLFGLTKKMTMLEYLDKYGRKLTYREVWEAANRYGLNGADKFVKQRHPENEDAILVGMQRGENTSGMPEVLFYKNEKTGEIFSDPGYYYEIIKRSK